MPRLRGFLALICIELFTPVDVVAQTNRTTQLQFFEFATRILADDLRTGKFGALERTSAALAWRVDGPNIDSTSNQAFERTMLTAVGGRRSTVRDSLARTLAASITVAATSAELRVDYGAVWCSRGQPVGSGTNYSYTFARTAERWVLVARVPTLSYDAAPPPRDSVPGDRCARAIAR